MFLVKFVSNKVRTNYTTFCILFRFTIRIYFAVVAYFYCSFIEISSVMVRFPFKWVRAYNNRTEFENNGRRTEKIREPLEIALFYEQEYAVKFVRVGHGCLGLKTAQRLVGIVLQISSLKIVASRCSPCRRMCSGEWINNSRTRSLPRSFAGGPARSLARPGRSLFNCNCELLLLTRGNI